MGAPALAQRLHVHHYTELDGLPSAHVHGVEQGPDGRIWFSTRMGIITYDGVRWELVESPFTPAPGVLETGADGALWVVPRNRPLEVARYHEGELTVFPESDFEVENYGLYAIQGVNAETVFVGGSGLGLVGYSGGEWRSFPLSGTSQETVYSLALRGQELLVAADSGLWSLDLEDLDRAPERIDVIPGGEVLGLENHDGVLWAVGNTWAGTLRGAEYTPLLVDTDPFVPYVGPIRLAVDLRGGLYLAHANRLAYLDSEGQLKGLDARNGLIAADALDVTVDREGIAWVVGLRGVSKIITRGIESYDTIEGLFADEVSAVLELPGQGVLTGHNGGLSLMLPGKIETLDFQAGPVRGRVMDLELAPDGSVWVGSTGLGIGRFSPGKAVEWLRLPTETQVHGVLEQGQVLWVATIDGLWRLIDGEYQRLEGHPLFEVPVRRLALASDGTLFCASMSEGLFCRHPDGTVEQWLGGSVFENNTFTVLLRDGEAPLVGTQAGVLEARDGALVRSRDFPVDAPTYLMVADEERRTVWIGTGRGVVAVSPDGMRVIGPRDGLAGPEANRDAGLVDDKGRFWVGTDRGLSVIWPTTYQGEPPTVALLGATYAGTPLELEGGPIRADSHGGPLVLAFRATAFLDEERTLFRHRLEGLESEWVGPSPEPTRELSYPALPAGTYRLHLQAIGADGRVSEEVVSTAITIPAPIYGRVWFQGGLVLLALGAVWGLVAQRAQRTYAQQLEEQVQTRTVQLQDSELILEADRARLEAMLASIADGVAATDTMERVILWNTAAADLTGKRAAEVMGLPLHEVLGAEEPFREGGVIQFETLEGSGESRILEASSAPFASSGVVVAFRDVTARMRLERDLARTQRLESLGLLAGGIAHDFNNYLTVVIGTLGMLREEHALSSVQREQVCVAEQTMNRAVSLTQQLLTFSTGGAPLRQDVAIGGLLEDAAAFALSGSNVVANLELADGLWEAHVDPGQIAQVLHNLLLNARQVMPDGGSIHLRASNVTEQLVDLPAGDWVLIEVEDEGPGMPADLQSRIFDPFFSAREGGTGLGLAITHSIISRHGGRISVDSQLGRGTCFEILLPGVVRSLSRRREESKADSTRVARVLVMDDEESIRAMLTRMLGHLGHRCVVVEEGGQAVEAYRDAVTNDDPFDAVLLDLTIIGGMGGKETAQQLLELDPLACLVAASGYSNDAVLGDHARFGFKAALAKPFRLEELRQVLELALGGARPA